MSRSTESVEIITKAARERLPARHEPHWRGIEGGLALGYRKSERGGTWVARLWDGARYRKTTLGRADDAVKATLTGSEAARGDAVIKVLDFRQAQAAAQEWARRIHRVAAGLEPEMPVRPAAPYTVANAVADYLVDYGARGGKALSATRTAVEAHILPALGAIPVSMLTRAKLKAWHHALAASPARLRSKPGEVRYRDPEDDSDTSRRRRSSANRILTILKAVLNHAQSEGKVTSPADAWSVVKPFREADKARVRYLLDDEATRLVNACPRDFRNLVTAALLTGCRYGELAALKAVDFDPQAGTVTIGRSKSGKPRHVALTEEGRLFFQQMTAGRKGSALLFERDRVLKQATKLTAAETIRVPWRKSDQFRAIRDACAAAKISPAVSFHELRHSYGARLAMRGVPMGVIAAQLGHADTRMTERHYAHLSPTYVAQTVRNSFGILGILQHSSVTPMRRPG